MRETIREARLKELQFRLSEEKRLRILATYGNIFAKYELNYNKTGLAVNLEALLPFDCSHALETPFGYQIPLRLANRYTTIDGFQVIDVICPICGKTVEMSIEKKKEPIRGC